MIAGRALACALPTRTPSQPPSSAAVMRSPRSWVLSEVAIAARAILAVEREAARARERAGTLLQFGGGSEAHEATARRWNRSKNWLRMVLEVHGAAVSEPERFVPLLRFMDSLGSPHPAHVWLQENREDPDAMVPPPVEGRMRPLVTGPWRMSDVDLAGRALLAAHLEAGDLGPNVRRFDPAGHRRRAMTQVARLWGESADWLTKVFEVSEAAIAEPDLFGHLVDVMDRAGRPTAAWTRLGSIRDEQRVLGLVPVTGRFRTLVLDPPWNEDNVSTASGHDYAQMSIDQIRALPVGQWADDDAHLYLWFTSNILPLIPQLLEAWGFEHKALHTWVKETADPERNDPKLGLGRYYRNTTEFFVFATRGTRSALPRRMATLSTPTHHRWPTTGLRNSEKPEGFYELVRACSYGPFGEAFQRQARPDFINLYQEAGPVGIAAQ